MIIAFLTVHISSNFKSVKHEKTTREEQRARTASDVSTHVARERCTIWNIQMWGIPLPTKDFSFNPKYDERLTLESKYRPRNWRNDRHFNCHHLETHSQVLTFHTFPEI